MKCGVDIIDGKDHLTEEGFLQVLSRSAYLPTKERLKQRILQYTKPDIAVLAAVYREVICGVLVVRIVSAHQAEILDIAVSREMEHSGIGRALLSRLIQEYRPMEVFAQTDDDAVGFYRHLGFEIRLAQKQYEGVTRYDCIRSCIDVSAEA